jgi:ATP-dependent helicase Lhr and Lhr-like helicase
MFHRHFQFLCVGTLSVGAARAAYSHQRAYRMDVASCFHPAVAAWFNQSFTTPTAAQAQAWPAIQAGQHVLIAAPTGSGKTLAAFLAAIDTLVRQGLDGRLENKTQVVYVSPLKALSNDINRNLETPLAGIRAALRAQGLPDVEIRISVRTGDTPPGERDRMRSHRRTSLSRRVASENSVRLGSGPDRIRT